MIRLDLKDAKLKEELSAWQEKVSKAHRDLHEKTGTGNDYVGWVNWPLEFDKSEFERILQLKKRMEGKYDTVLVCGIGGSYLGARAAIEMIKGLYPDDLELILKRLLSSNPGGKAEVMKGHVMRYVAVVWNLRLSFSCSTKPLKMVTKRKSQLKLWIPVMA